MYKLGVVSDSHGASDKLRRAALALSGCDAVAHLGDYTSDARALAGLTGKPVYSVRGNCDPGSDAPEEIVTEIAGYRVLMCHGHRRAVKLNLTSLFFRAREAGADIALYGHTHLPDAERDGPILLVNPGALADGCCAVIEFRENGPCPLLQRL